MELPDELLRSNINLEVLMLQSNNLVNMTEKMFVGLGNLTTLAINNNIVELMHQDIFSSTPNLQKLYNINSEGKSCH